MANVDYFLKLDGISGESQDDQFPDQIELHSWSWGQTNDGSFGSGGGGGIGRVAIQDLICAMATNRASASVASACAVGRHIGSAELNCRKAGATPQVFLKIKLTDVLVSNYQVNGGGGSIVPLEQFALNFAKIEMAYGKQDPNGMVAALDQKFGWDVNRNKTT